MKSKLEWFPFYADDFLSSDYVQSMSMAERGLYITLLALLWKSERGLPTDEKVIAARVGLTPNRFRKIFMGISKKFVQIENGTRFINERLEEVRREQLDKAKSRSDKGRAAVKKRWDAERERQEHDTPSITDQIAIDKKRIEENKNTQKEPVSVSALKPWDKPESDDPDPNEVGEFLDAYRELYERTTGAKLPLVWSWKDMDHAKAILKTWPWSVKVKASVGESNGEPRVLKMAELFMVNKDNANKVKSLGMFRYAAPLADEQMRKVGL